MNLERLETLRGGMNVMALALLDGRIDTDRDLAQIVSACTTCGACDVACKFIMAAERQDVIIALKEHIAESGYAIPAKAEDKATLPHWSDGLKRKTLPEAHQSGTRPAYRVRSFLLCGAFKRASRSR